MAKHPCVMTHQGQFCLTSYPKTWRAGKKVTMRLNRHPGGRVNVMFSWTGPEPWHSGEGTPTAMVRGNAVTINLPAYDTGWWNVPAGASATVDRMAIMLVDQGGSRIDVGNPGVTVKMPGGPKLAAPRAPQPGAAQPLTHAPFRPILTTGPAVCTGPACQAPQQQPSIAARSTAPTSHKAGSLTIFPQTLQRQTVTRRYAKRRPGQ